MAPWLASAFLHHLPSDAQENSSISGPMIEAGAGACSRQLPLAVARLRSVLPPLLCPTLKPILPPIADSSIDLSPSSTLHSAAIRPPSAFQCVVEKHNE